MNTKQILSRFRYLKRKLQILESDFDAFIRRNMKNPEARDVYSKSANQKYFAIKDEMNSLRASYAIARNVELGEV